MKKRKFKKGDKVYYYSNERPKILCTVVDLDFDKGFYFLATEKHGRLIVDFKKESFMEKVEERSHKFNVGDIIQNIEDNYVHYQVIRVDFPAKRYACSTANGVIEFVPFENEKFWEYYGTYSPSDAKMETSLKERYCDLANDYLTEFIKQTGIEDDAPFWVGGEVAGIACVADYFVDYKTIRYVVDSKMMFVDFDEWYNYCADVKMVDDRLFTPTLEQWYNGEFTRISDERLEEMKNAKKDFEQLVQEEKEKQNA